MHEDMAVIYIERYSGEERKCIVIFVVECCGTHLSYEPVMKCHGDGLKKWLCGQSYLLLVRSVRFDGSDSMYV
jgi:hypothetical protein